MAAVEPAIITTPQSITMPPMEAQDEQPAALADKTFLAGKNISPEINISDPVIRNQFRMQDKGVRDTGIQNSFILQLRTTFMAAHEVTPFRQTTNNFFAIGIEPAIGAFFKDDLAHLTVLGTLAFQAQAGRNVRENIAVNDTLSAAHNVPLFRCLVAAFKLLFNG
jgi:hypothetical protein